MKNITNIPYYLKSNDIKPSFQRMKIFDYLYKNKNHPTVEMIYKELSGIIPTLSKTTIYNTLKLFVKKNIVIIVNIEDNETRYDADVSTHGHFKCIKCKEIYDFLFDTENLKIQNLKGFQKDKIDLYIKGICKECLFSG